MGPRGASWCKGFAKMMRAAEESLSPLIDLLRCTILKTQKSRREHPRKLITCPF